jgi:hypothetical protein
MKMAMFEGNWRDWWRKFGGRRRAFDNQPGEAGALPRCQPLTEVWLRHAAITPQAEALDRTALALRRLRETRWRTTATTATLLAAVREIEEVVPVNAVSTWVLPSGVTVGR